MYCIVEFGTETNPFSRRCWQGGSRDFRSCKSDGTPAGVKALCNRGDCGLLKAQAIINPQFISFGTEKHESNWHPRGQPFWAQV